MGGQDRLEKARVAIIGAAGEATELAKSLILAGVGGVELVDCQLVEWADVAHSFFLTAETVGTFRSRASARSLGALNPQCSVTAETRDPNWLVVHAIGYFDSFDLVVDTLLARASLLALDHHLRTLSRVVPLGVVRTCGLVASVKFSYSGFGSFDTHPENPPLDLRLAEPFPSLRLWLDAFLPAPMENAAAASKRSESDLPSLALLYSAVHTWRSDHAMAWPGRTEQASIRSNIAASHPASAAVDEAVRPALVRDACTPYAVPSAALELLRQSASRPVTAAAWSECEGFWARVAAVARFVQESGFLPLSGKLPDLVCSTEDYLALQRLYSRKAAEDAERVLHHFRAIADECQCTEPLPRADEWIRQTCAGFQSAVWCSTPELAAGADWTDTRRMDAADAPSGMALWFAVWSAAECLEARLGKWPTQDQRELLLSDLRRMCEETLWKEAELRADELLRYGQKCMHPVAALAAAVTAQECLKHLTGQWVPMSQSWMYDGLRSLASS